MMRHTPNTCDRLCMCCLGSLPHTLSCRGKSLSSSYRLMRQLQSRWRSSRHMLHDKQHVNGPHTRTRKNTHTHTHTRTDTDIKTHTPTQEPLPAGLRYLPFGQPVQCVEPPPLHVVQLASQAARRKKRKNTVNDRPTQPIE